MKFNSIIWNADKEFEASAILLNESTCLKEFK